MLKTIVRFSPVVVSMWTKSDRNPLQAPRDCPSLLNPGYFCESHWYSAAMPSRSFGASMTTAVSQLPPSTACDGAGVAAGG
ncbi:MAG: hypothetical protein M3542_07615 [Acidobacteriota bacterium]|nr:hypothetical protein [Acidobacteriota bacterium]MDQ5871202.1 hypothetical protein [Acidobacteriota bacterium]